MRTIKEIKFVIVLIILLAGGYCQNVPAQALEIGLPRDGSPVSVWEFSGDAVRADGLDRSPFNKGEALPIVITSAEVISAAAILEFTLPSGQQLTGVRRSAATVVVASSGSWEGVLYSSESAESGGDNRPRGEVILSFNVDSVSGVLYDSDAVYEILPVAANHYLVKYATEKGDHCRVAVDENTPDQLATADVIDNVFGVENSDRNFISGSRGANSATISPRAAAGQPEDSGDRVDVLVVYTAAVADNFGGTAQTELFAQTALTSANTVFRNSRNRVRVNSVRTAQIGYPESGNLSFDLNWLKASPEVAQMRNESFADLVVMLVNAGDACGTSQLLTASGVNAGSGFSVVKRSCAVGGTAFAHEVGHLFGADHDPLDSPIPPSMHVLPFAYGKAVNGQFVTLMGFFSNSICPDYCPRLLMFSNPAILFNGIPTGISGLRDNASVVEYTADRVANLRTSPQTITIYSPNNNVTWRRNMPREVRWNSNGIIGQVQIQLSRDGGQTFQTLSANSVNDGSETIVLTGPTTRQARIRVISIENPIITDTGLTNFSLL